MSETAILLISEARGEFLMVEAIRSHLQAAGRRVVHVTASANDVTRAERGSSGVIVLEDEPIHQEMSSVSDPLERLRELERCLGVNMRSVWRADLRSWREGASDAAMARLAIGHLSAWEQILARHDPVGLVWGEDGGHLAKRTAFLLAEQREIPLAFLYVSPLPGRMLYLDNALNRFPASALSDIVVTESERLYAMGVLADVRGSRVQFATPRDLAFRPARVSRFARLLWRRYVTRPAGSRTLYPWTFARSYARQRAARGTLRSSYRTVGTAPFVFHPLHAGNDAQISIRAPQWRDQLALVEHVASSLPYGFELAIKEHPFEVGALPVSRLVSLLRRNPQIRLLDPSIHAHEVLRRCSAVTTVNSTTGFEGLFFLRPVITYGHGPYRGLGLTHDVGDPFDSPHVLQQVLTGGPPAEEDVIRLIALMLRNSFEATSLAYNTGPGNIRRYAEIFGEIADRAR